MQSIINPPHQHQITSYHVISTNKKQKCNTLCMFDKKAAAPFIIVAVLWLFSLQHHSTVKQTQGKLNVSETTNKYSLTWTKKKWEQIGQTSHQISFLSSPVMLLHVSPQPFAHLTGSPPNILFVDHSTKTKRTAISLCCLICLCFITQQHLFQFIKSNANTINPQICGECQQTNKQSINNTQQCKHTNHIINANHKHNDCNQLSIIQQLSLSYQQITNNK